MFRQLCLMAVAFLAVAEAKNHTAKSIKDSKSCGSSNKKSKTATFCVLVSDAAPPAIVVDGASIHSYTQGALFDCDDVPPFTSNDFFGTLGLSCDGLWDSNIDGAVDGSVLCTGLITVNTEDNKQAKQDFSSMAFTALGPIDIQTGGKPVLGDATGLVINGANGAWGKPENIKDVSFTTTDTDIRDGGIYKVTVQYKTRGFNPLP